MARFNVNANVSVNLEDRPDGRARIVQRARELFIERGFADVSMQQIADAAGLRKASLYHHFKDKNALFTEIVLGEMRRIGQAAAERIEQGGDFSSTIEDLAFGQFTQLRSDVMRLMRDFRQHVPESEHEEVHAELLTFAAILERPFLRAADEGITFEVEPKLAALLFFHMVMAISEHGYIEPVVAVPEPRGAAKLVTRILLNGIIDRAE